MTDQNEEAIPLDKLARVYRKIRDRIQLLTQDYEKTVEELKEQQTAITIAMKDHMLAIGSTSIKTNEGTIILSEKTRYYTDDWDAFKSFVREHDAFDLFEKRIHQTNMVTFLEENPGEVPPGLNSSTEYAISVRKPTSK